MATLDELGFTTVDMADTFHKRIKNNKRYYKCKMYFYRL